MILYCDTCGKQANITTNGMCDACFYKYPVRLKPDAFINRAAYEKYLKDEEKYTPVEKKDKNK